MEIFNIIIDWEKWEKEKTSEKNPKDKSKFFLLPNLHYNQYLQYKLYQTIPKRQKSEVSSKISS